MKKEELVNMAQAVIDEIDALVDESDGVYGLHLNGDVAQWGEILTGGRFERLTSVEALREALRSQAGAVPDEKVLIQSAGKSLKELGAYLAKVLDEDQFSHAEEYLLKLAGNSCFGFVGALVDWVRSAPHGDNCFLHKDGGEFDSCFCGKDSLLSAIDNYAAPPSPAADEHAQYRMTIGISFLEHLRGLVAMAAVGHQPDAGICRSAVESCDSLLSARKADGTKEAKQ